MKNNMAQSINTTNYLQMKKVKYFTQEEKFSYSALGFGTYLGPINDLIDQKYAEALEIGL